MGDYTTYILIVAILFMAYLIYKQTNKYLDKAADNKDLEKTVEKQEKEVIKLEDKVKELERQNTNLYQSKMRFKRNFKELHQAMIEHIQPGQITLRVYESIMETYKNNTK